MVKCPICHTLSNHTGAELCAQCGSDLSIHQTLDQLQQSFGNKKTMESSTKNKSFFYIMSVLMICILCLTVFVGYLSLKLINSLELQNQAASKQVALISQTQVETFENLTKTANMALESLLEEQKNRRELVSELKSLHEERINQLKLAGEQQDQK